MIATLVGLTTLVACVTSLPGYWYLLRQSGIDLVVNSEDTSSVHHLAVDDMFEYRNSGSYILSGAVADIESNRSLAVWKIDDKGVIDPYFGDRGRYIHMPHESTLQSAVGRKVYVDSKGTIYCFGERQSVEDSSLFLVCLDASGQLLVSREFNTSNGPIQARASIMLDDKVLLFSVQKNSGKGIALRIITASSTGIESKIVNSDIKSEGEIRIDYACRLLEDDEFYLVARKESPDSSEINILRLSSDFSIDHDFGNEGTVSLNQEILASPRVVSVHADGEKVYLIARETASAAEASRPKSLMIILSKQEEKIESTEPILVPIRGTAEDVCVFREGVFVSGSARISDEVSLFTVWKITKQGKELDPYDIGAFFYAFSESKRSDSAGAMIMNSAENTLYIGGNYNFDGKDELMILKGNSSFFQVYSTE